MPIVAGNLPQDGGGARSAGGYAPGAGVLPFQLGTPSGDTTAGANNQQSAPLVVQQVAPSSVSGTLQSAAGATGAGTALSVLGNSSVQFTVTGTFVGTITWQGSEDGTNYSSLYATQLGTNTIATTATGTGIFEASVSGLQKVQANITGYTSGQITVTAHAVPGSFSPRITNVNVVAGAAVIGSTTIQAASGTALQADVSNTELKVSNYVKGSAAGDTALTLGQATMANSLPVAIASNQGAIGSLGAGSATIGAVVPTDGTKATYTYAVSATAPYASTQDWIVIRGSGTKTVKIRRVEISGAATSATEIIATLKKHTIANTGGTSTTPTPMQHDSADGAATATVLLYSAGPTIDNSATIWKSVRLTLAVAPAATANNPDRYVYDCGNEAYEPLTLRGVAQECALNFAGAALPSGGVYDVAITFSEE